jgi:hypothetical protein
MALTNPHTSQRKLRPHFSATLAAGGADEARLDIRQPYVIRPAIGAHRCRMTATVIAAIDQHLAHKTPTWDQAGAGGLPTMTSGSLKVASLFGGLRAVVGFRNHVGRQRFIGRGPGGGDVGGPGVAETLFQRPQQCAADDGIVLGLGRRSRHDAWRAHWRPAGSIRDH